MLNILIIQLKRVILNNLLRKPLSLVFKLLYSQINMATTNNILAIKERCQIYIIMIRKGIEAQIGLRFKASNGIILSTFKVNVTLRR